ncbi:hypothetical protein Tco_0846863 [Tanacetum coccineum]
MKKAFQDMLHELWEVNPVHAYYNGFRTSKDNEDPSWSTSFKTSRTQKTSSALEALWKTLFLCCIYVNEVVKDVKVANSVEDDSIDDLNDLNENLNNLDHHFKDMENLENDFSVQPDTLMKEENVTQHETQKEEEVRMLQKSQESGQNQTNTDTRKERVHKSRESDSKKGGQKDNMDQQLVNP